jgi:hypothetical protein
MDDAVTFDDLARAMSRAWAREKLPTNPGSVDAVVHSTGGLVIRAWVAKNFKPDTVPIKNIAMLAPANFGSPLAHKGYSFIGRVVKGWKSEKRFETGEKLLKGLELASPYTWDLAMRDRFGRDDFYGKGRILCTVLVGNSGFNGISAAANEEGSDGTVRVSTANLNCAYLDADFATDPRAPRTKLTLSEGNVAFGVMGGENHRTIRGKFQNADTLKFLLKGLTVRDDEFQAWCNELGKHTASTMKDGAGKLYTHGFQNTVVLVRDDAGSDVRDYFIEFYVEGRKSGWFEEMFHEEVIRTVHPHTDASAYRSILIDCTRLHEEVQKKNGRMKVSLTAFPEFLKNRNVGYRTFADADIGGIPIPFEKLKNWFQENRTLLVRITLRREQADSIFRFSRS